MLKKSKKLSGLLSILLLITVAVTGCGTNSGPDADDGQTTGELEGGIIMAGSTSMEKLANASAESFMLKHPGVRINAEFTGSSAGVEALLAGTVDIGNSSRSLKESEIEAGAVENVVAIDGIAVIVDAANTIDGLNKQQLIDLYTGKVRNWSELGGPDSVVVVVGREAGSGTRGAFEEILGVEEACVYANELDSTGAVMAKVASTEGAVGYVSMDVLNETVKPVKLDGIEPTEENIKAGTYFLSRPFVMATRGEISEQSPIIQAYFDWLKSEEGKAVIEAVGLIAVE